MRYTTRIIAAAGWLLAARAGAQHDRQWEFRPLAGAAMPTGAHRQAFEDAAFFGGQTALRLTTTVDVVGTFGWQPSTSKYGVSTRGADVWVYNVGLERGFRQEAPSRAALVPFIGGGVGGRAYDFRSSSLTSTTCYAGYGSAGVSYERGVSTTRLELRDNLFCYNSPMPGFEADTRNEVNVLLGVGFRF